MSTSQTIWLLEKYSATRTEKEVLISFLNAILLLQNDNRIVTAGILRPYQLSALKGGKVAFVSLKAKDLNDKNYIVEMQVAEVDGYDKMVL